MRITGGALKGRTVPDVKQNLRPTTNRAKQGLLNMLAHRVEWELCNALELFGGTGNLTYEMASRGCRSITTVGINRINCNLIRQNVKQLGLNNVRVIRADALSFLKNSRESWSLIFADPPYDYRYHETLVGLVFEKKLLKEDGFLVVEHSRRTTFTALPSFIEQRKYGEVNFSFFGEKALQ